MQLFSKMYFPFCNWRVFHYLLSLYRVGYALKLWSFAGIYVVWIYIVIFILFCFLFLCIPDCKETCNGLITFIAGLTNT